MTKRDYNRIANAMNAFGVFFTIGVYAMKQERYRVTADHPTFARPDKIVSGVELEAFLHELRLAGFENIKYEKIEEKS